MYDVSLGAASRRGMNNNGGRLLPATAQPQNNPFANQTAMDLMAVSVGPAARGRATGKKKDSINSPDFLALAREARRRARPTDSGRLSTIKNRTARIQLGL